MAVLYRNAVARTAIELVIDRRIYKRARQLELVQTQMTEKPMLRAEVYACALRASQNHKGDSA